MTCCPPGAHAFTDPQAQGSEDDDRTLLALSRRLSENARQLEFAVPDAHCAACIRAIESGLLTLSQVTTARVNLSRRRVRIVFDPALGNPGALAATIRAAGYHTYALDPAADEDGDPVLRELVRALAVAGFAAGNIMLFSVAIWAGADAATRDLFHWISAIIALPAIAYSGRIFFRSAWRALRVGKTNMDVPISIGVTLATALSLFETIGSGEHAYFDASATLLFFLLAGRTLDHLMRERARTAITNLARLSPRGATRLTETGGREYVALDEIAPGMLLELKAGERCPVDCTIIDGPARFDNSFVTGEVAPNIVSSGGEVLAGANNLGGLVVLRAERPARDSFISSMVALMEAAEGAKTRQRRIADRAAAIYAPIVHAIAASTFLGWGLLSGDWHAALLNAVAVLIITCPCALALAVPIVHVVAAGRLFERGVLMKDGAALERAAEATSVAFDKTGTLTVGRPVLVAHQVDDSEAEALARGMALASNHPLSRAIALSMGDGAIAGSDIRETPGLGMQCELGGATWRLGNPGWSGPLLDGVPGSVVALSCDGKVRGRFQFDDAMRPEAPEVVRDLATMGLPVRLLSGDAAEPVARIAAAAGIAEAHGGLLPEQKVAAVADGYTMMVGDGINDAPALRAAHVSMAPSSAADIGRVAADFVFTASDLGAVTYVLTTARKAARIVNQNLALAIAYNIVAVPLAVTGMVTPLIAAIAMSSSSLIVVVNATRLRVPTPRRSAVASAPHPVEAAP